MACRLFGGSHYANHCWFNIGCVLGNKIQCNWNQNINISPLIKCFLDVSFTKGRAVSNSSRICAFYLEPFGSLQEFVPHFIHIPDSGLIRRISPFLFLLQLHKGRDVITHPCTKTWSKGMDESLHQTREGMVSITCPCHYITHSIQCVSGMWEVKYSWVLFTRILAIAGFRSLGMDKWLNPALYNGCNYLSILGLKLSHVGKRGPGQQQTEW